MNLITILPIAAGPQVSALLALIVCQVLLSVALALKQRKFQWSKLADFYLRYVVPLLIGWLAFAVLVRFASSEVLGPTYGPAVSEGLSWAAWLSVVGTLFSRIGSAAKQLYGQFKLPIPEHTDMQGP